MQLTVLHVREVQLLRKDGVRSLQKVRKALQESGALRDLQGLLGQHGQAQQVQGALSQTFYF